MFFATFLNFGNCDTCTGDLVRNADVRSYERVPPKALTTNVSCHEDLRTLSGEKKEISE